MGGEAEIWAVAGKLDHNIQQNTLEAKIQVDTLAFNLFTNFTHSYTCYLLPAW